MARVAITDLQPLVSLAKLEALLGRDRSDYFRLAGCAGRYYSSFDMRRVGDKKWRHIDNPKGELKVIQSQIQRKILATAALPKCMLGSVPGYSIRDNLNKHRAPEYLVTLDLRACFPSTSHHDVLSVYTKYFGCSSEIAEALTKLTSLQHRLPQGAPTSSTLANLTLIELAHRLQSLAADLDLVFSMWVDDIAFSGARALEMIEPAIQTIMRLGHSVQRRKIKIMPRSSRQELTGGVVNRKVSAGRRARVQPLRERILQLSSMPVVEESELRSIEGSISHIEWLSAVQGAALRRLAERLLPSSGPLGQKLKRLETRPCHSTRQHVARPRRARSVGGGGSDQKRLAASGTT